MGFAVNHHRRSRLAGLLWAAAVCALGGLAAEAQSPAPAPPDTAATARTLMARGVEAYDGGNNGVALDVFHQAAAIGVVDAMMYLGVMYGDRPRRGSRSRGVHGLVPTCGGRR